MNCGIKLVTLSCTKLGICPKQNDCSKVYEKIFVDIKATGEFITLYCSGLSQIYQDPIAPSYLI